MTPYQRLGISYNYTPTEGWLNKFSVQLAQQKVSQQANSNQYGTSTNPYPDYNIIIQKRLYKTEQKHYQIDVSLIANEVAGKFARHQLSGGLGYHWGKLENRNQEVNYNAYSKKQHNVNLLFNNLLLVKLGTLIYKI